MLPAVGGLALCALSAWSTCAAAGEFTVHGFGTVGLTYVDQPDGWAYTRTYNQRVSESDIRADLDSVLGLQFNYSPSAQFELVGQLAAMGLDGDARASDYVELAFLAFHPNADWSARIGRVNLDAYLLSDHRDVGFTYGFIRPPVEFYSRTPTSLDGADITRTWLVGDAQWQAKLFGGRSSTGTGGGRLNLDPLFGFMIARETQGLQLRLSAVSTRLENTPTSLQPLIGALNQLEMLPVPQVASEAEVRRTAVDAQGLRTYYVAVGAAYDRNDWLLSAELNRSRTAHSDSTSYKSGYVSGGRRFGRVSVLLTQSMTLRDSSTLDTPDWATPLAPFGATLAQQAQILAVASTLVANKTAGHQNTTSLGMRWDLAPQMALKAQWDHIHTFRGGDGLWHQGDGRSSSSNVLGVALDFIF